MRCWWLSRRWASTSGEAWAGQRPPTGCMHLGLPSFPLGFASQLCPSHHVTCCRDVLNVLGMYPGDPGPPGSDCAGVIMHAGSAVQGLQPGPQGALATSPNVPLLGHSSNTNCSRRSLHLPVCRGCRVWLGTRVPGHGCCVARCHAGTLARHPQLPRGGHHPDRLHHW